MAKNMVMKGASFRAPPRSTLRGGGPVVVYKRFKEQLNGWLEVDYTTFKRDVVPLRSLKVWSAAQQDAVALIARRGGGFALRQYLGNSEPLTALLAARDLTDRPEPLALPVVASMLRGLYDAKTRDWKRESFISYLAYLNSTMSKDDLKETQRPDALEEAVALTAAAKAAPLTAAAAAEYAAKEFDLRSLTTETFYRSGSPAVRAAIEAYFTTAAAAAPPAVRTPPPVESAASIIADAKDVKSSKN